MTDDKANYHVDNEELEHRVRDALRPVGLRDIVVDADEGLIVLAGTVGSDDDFTIAQQIARNVEGVRQVINNLLVEPPGPPEQDIFGGPVAGEISYERYDDVRGGNTDIDFTDDIGTNEQFMSAEEAIPYFPSTDPVVLPVPDGEGIEIAGGFAPTSMDEEGEDWHEPDRLKSGDYDIAEHVQRALHLDAATSDLQIEVHVRNGVVFLRGKVPTLQDAEMAEEVAGRVPGVVEVEEELEVGLE